MHPSWNAILSAWGRHSTMEEHTATHDLQRNSGKGALMSKLLNCAAWCYDAHCPFVCDAREFGSAFRIALHLKGYRTGPQSLQLRHHKWQGSCKPDLGRCRPSNAVAAACAASPTEPMAIVLLSEILVSARELGYPARWEHPVSKLAYAS